jgi:hypothetical protein
MFTPKAKDGLKPWSSDIVTFEVHHLISLSPFPQTRVLFKFLWYVLQPIHLKEIEMNLGQYLYVSIRSSICFSSCFCKTLFAHL